MTQSFQLTNGDLVLNSAGNLPLVSGLQTCVQNCQTAMSAVQGEMMYAKTQGMPYQTVVWDRYWPKLFAAAAKSVLLNVQDVTGILSFSQSMTGNVLSYTAVIQTIYGTATVSS